MVNNKSPFCLNFCKTLPIPEIESSLFIKPSTRKSCLFEWNLRNVINTEISDATIGVRLVEILLSGRFVMEKSTAISLTLKKTLVKIAILPANNLFLLLSRL